MPGFAFFFKYSAYNAWIDVDLFTPCSIILFYARVQSAKWPTLEFSVETCFDMRTVVIKRIRSIATQNRYKASLFNNLDTTFRKCTYFY